MKKSVYILLLAALAIGCKKAGDIVYKVKYTTSALELRTANLLPDSLYSGYGDYITSITPYHLSSKIGMLMYSDHWDQSINGTHMISYVDGHDNDPRYEIATYADFSGNQEVQIDPILYGSDLWDGIYKQKQIYFDFFIFSPRYIYQEFEVPIEYKAVVQANNNNLPQNAAAVTYDANSNKLYGKGNEGQFIYPIFQNSVGMNGAFAYVFGNTDSTFIYMYNNQSMDESKRFPFWNEGGKAVVRCSKYSPITVTMPDADQTITMYSTISFDCTNLIQVYAGKDNIAYTADDVFIYAPKYWERLKVRLDVY